MSEYLQAINLETQLQQTFVELGIPSEQKDEALALLNTLKDKGEFHHQHYEHSIRVGLLAKKIGAFMHLDERALFYAGVFHDLGKSEIDPSLLGKTTEWSDEDKEKIKEHVLSGYNMLKGKFDFSAEIIVLHHSFQPDDYPKDLPQAMHNYSKGTRILIADYARIIAIADQYDALHRTNSRFGDMKTLSDREIEDLMIQQNPDRKDLIEDLYRASIFVNFQKEQETDRQKELYESIWEEVDIRSPQETEREVILAAALEPISDKGGNTTRYTNLSRFLKLEYFITAGINLGSSFNELATRIDQSGQQPEVIYDLALKAQKDSLKNRSGGRINQGIIELLIPIVASQHLFNKDRKLSAQEVLIKAKEILSNTSPEDVSKLREMKRFAFDMSNYLDRKIPEYSEINNVLEYYQKDMDNSDNPTSKAHNGEFIKGFPSVLVVYDTLSQLGQKRFTDKIEHAYRSLLVTHGINVGRGFIADCIAAGIYLYLSQNPKAKLIQ